MPFTRAPSCATGPLQRGRTYYVSTAPVPTPSSDRCRNCDTEFAGEYYHRCRQSALTPTRCASGGGSLTRRRGPQPRLQDRADAHGIAAHAPYASGALKWTYVESTVRVLWKCAALLVFGRVLDSLANVGSILSRRGTRLIRITPGRAAALPRGCTGRECRRPRMHLDHPPAPRCLRRTRSGSARLISRRHLDLQPAGR